MKKTLLLFVLFISVTFLKAQSVQITGKIISERRPDEIVIMSIVDGITSVISSSVPSADGSVGFCFTPDYEGFYLIGSRKNLSPQFPIYIKGGENFNVIINDKKIQYLGKLSVENIIVAQWVEMSQVVAEKSHYWQSSRSIYEDFFPDLEALAAKVPSFTDGIKTKNTKFNNLMKDYVNFSTDYYALYFLRVPRSKHPMKSDMSGFYGKIKKVNNFPNDNVLNIPFGQRYLSLYVNFVTETTKDLNEQISVLSTDKQKAEHLLNDVLLRMKSYDLYQDFVENYGNYFKTEKHRIALEDIGAKLYETKAGGAAADFTYPDINGKSVSLSDFKGKVVLVDVWATWCGPCKQQIPFAKKLEEELHGMDVVFLNVSVDEEKDKEKWKQMVIDEKLGGVHIFAGGWSKICKDYKITGIPRFMLFDKNGNIITTEAPRPSDPELKALIMKYLKK
jgi:thiol-disulfide isomerase/thioredoxin